MNSHVLGLVFAISSATLVFGGNPYPSVELSPLVPESVRDATARFLAAGREALGWSIHPFRGEFHGLGGPGGAISRAYDLSADGRVVVGTNLGEWPESNAFVWTPWTGNATYDLSRNGVLAPTGATAVSADGVYVAGYSYLDYQKASGFRWSLAGTQHFDPPSGRDIDLSALSADGQVVVGSAKLNPSPCGSYTNCLNTGALVDEPYSVAVSYEPSQEVKSLDGPVGFTEFYATDVSADGLRILLSTHDDAWQYEEEPSDQLVREPYLLSRTDGSLTPLGTPNIPRNLSPGVVALPYTRGYGISADGSTVIGSQSYKHVTTQPSRRRIYNHPNEQAVMWRQGAGWIDLGDLRHSGAGGAIVTERVKGVSGDGSIVIGRIERYTPCDGGLGCSTLSSFRYEITHFYWDEARGMRDLSQVLELDYGLELADWYINEVTGISDDGTTLIGNGWRPEGGSEAWRAVLHRNSQHGDIDFDGDVDHDDYQRLIDNLGATSQSDAVFYSDGDLNADGIVDNDDARTLLGLYDYRWTGDFNANGVVDAGDYSLWRDLSGQVTDGVADSNGDGQVDHQDLAVWRLNYGRAVDAILGTVVPEPCTAWLQAVVSAIAAARISRRCRS